MAHADNSVFVATSLMQLKAESLPEEAKNWENADVMICEWQEGDVANAIGGFSYAFASKWTNFLKIKLKWFIFSLKREHIGAILEDSKITIVSGNHLPPWDQYAIFVIG